MPFGKIAQYTQFKFQKLTIMNSILPFQKLREDAATLEEQILFTTQKASTYASAVVEKIELVFKEAGSEFIKLMETRWQNYQFYAELGNELNKRLINRRVSPRNGPLNNVYVDMRNVRMFGAIATSLNESDFDTETNNFVNPTGTKSISRKDFLHASLHIIEFIAAYSHKMNYYGHMIGPATGLIIGELERRNHAKYVGTENVFLKISDLLEELKISDAFLNEVAVRVYRIPGFWPIMGDDQDQLRQRNIVEGERISAFDAISLQEATKAVSNALDLHRNKIGPVSLKFPKKALA